MKRTIEVTQQHIDRGICFEPGNCALAIALSEAFPCHEVVVCNDRAYFYALMSWEQTCVTLPQEAIAFIVDFDFSDHMENPRPTPMSFVIELPEGFNAVDRIETPVDLELVKP